MPKSIWASSTTFFNAFLRLFTLLLDSIVLNINQKVYSMKETAQTLVSVWISSEYVLPSCSTTDISASKAQKVQPSYPVDAETSISTTNEQDEPQYLPILERYAEKSTKSELSTGIYTTSSSSAQQLSTPTNFTYESEVQGGPMNTRSYYESHKRVHYTSKRRNMDFTNLKLDEYNQKNSQYVLRKSFELRVKVYGGSSSQSDSYSQASTQQKGFSSPVRSYTMLSTLGKMRKPIKNRTMRRRTCPFQPTELSTIYENLAY